MFPRCASVRKHKSHDNVQSRLPWIPGLLKTEQNQQFHCRNSLCNRWNTTQGIMANTGICWHFREEQCEKSSSTSSPHQKKNLRKCLQCLHCYSISPIRESFNSIPKWIWYSGLKLGEYFEKGHNKYNFLKEFCSIHKTCIFLCFLRYTDFTWALITDNACFVLHWCPWYIYYRNSPRILFPHLD